MKTFAAASKKLGKSKKNQSHQNQTRSSKEEGTDGSKGDQILKVGLVRKWKTIVKNVHIKPSILDGQNPAWIEGTRKKRKISFAFCARKTEDI